MRFVDASEINRILTFPLLIAAFEEAHKRPPAQVLDASLGGAQAQYVVRSAYDGGRYMASKIYTSFPANLAQGILPAVQAVCVLFDGVDGRPLAVMDGTEITRWRTAADSALAATYMAPAEPETLLVVGAGVMAGWLVAAHRAARPSLRRVVIWNRTESRGQAVAAKLREEGLDAQAVANLDNAVANADIISACTRSHEPLIRGGLLKPGAHVDLVGGYTLATREADDEAVRRGRLFVDRRESAFDVGDMAGPLANGTIREADILGDLYDLATGAVDGRLAAADITVFKNAGGGHLDLMTCELIYRLLGAGESQGEETRHTKPARGPEHA